MTNHNEQVKQSNSEKISNLIHTVEKGTAFKSFRDLCKYFGLKDTGGNSKKALLVELSRHCNWESKGNKFIITDVFTSPHPKINIRFLNSKYYPSCGYQLLVTLAKEKNYDEDEDEKVYYLTNKKIMKTVFLCNNNYSNANLDLAKKDNESSFFISEVGRHLNNIIKNMLVSLKSHKFLTYTQCYMLIDNYGKHREATDEETNRIDEYYGVILNRYYLNKKNGIRLSKHKKEIDREFEDHIGYRHYISNKFNIPIDLASNAEYLCSEAKLTEQYGVEVNTLICDDIYNLVFNRIISIRDKENNEHANEAKELAKQPELTCEQEFEQFIQELEEKGVITTPTKFNKIWNFDSDDDIVKNKIENLITQFIRADFTELELEILS